MNMNKVQVEISSFIVGNREIVLNMLDIKVKVLFCFVMCIFRMCLSYVLSLPQNTIIARLT